MPQVFGFDADQNCGSSTKEIGVFGFQLWFASPSQKAVLA